MGKYDALNYADRALKLTGENGAFLVTGKGGKNVMTIGYSAQAVMWYRSVFIVPVRENRFTHTILETDKEFTVFVPSEKMTREIILCGSKSGRDTDKFALCGFQLLPSEAVEVPHISGNGFVYECRILYETNIDPDKLLDWSLVKSDYSASDAGLTHTLYFAEILNAYESKSL
ncbi:hypothetical protein FACS18947_1020 [Bacteroidia bacterium]|nr:hypothetical protein FACS18947_1020 [Bacteroidia bacterium]